MGCSSSLIGLTCVPGVQEDKCACVARRLLHEVGRGEPQWDEVAHLLAERSANQRLYRCTIQLKRLFRVELGEILQGYWQRSARELGGPTQLFHGTTPNAAERIVQAGFESGHAGMLGPGIYFAEDPLKAVQYARQGSRDGTRPGLLAHSLCGGGGERAELVRHMLLCDVYLGRSRTIRSARPRFNPSKDLRRNRFLRWVGASSYNSVHVPEGRDKVTEFVVYSESQAIPRFLVEFEPVPLGFSML